MRLPSYFQRRFSEAFYSQIINITGYFHKHSWGLIEVKEKKEDKTIESRNDSIQTEKRKFRLYEHPWLSLLAVILTTVLLSILTGIVVSVLTRMPYDSPTAVIATALSYHTLTVFLFAPFVLRLPKGKRTFRQYLDDIGLTRMQLFFWLVLLALSCYVILALSQVAASFVYRLFEGQPINWSFIQQVFDPSIDLPPASLSLLNSIPSLF
jgi:hypothetical protein